MLNLCNPNELKPETFRVAVNAESTPNEPEVCNQLPCQKFNATWIFSFFQNRRDVFQAHGWSHDLASHNWQKGSWQASVAVYVLIP